MELNHTTMENISVYTEKVISMVIDYGPKLIGALLLLVAGLWIIKIFVRWFVRIMVKSNVDDSLRPFLRSLLANLLKTLLIISVLVMIGIEMTSFIAILAAAGLAVGMALSGTLQNFAGGVMILLFRPFRIGDFIDAMGFAGTVKEIQVFNTILKTPDNRTIIIPNGGLSGSAMTNFSAETKRRVDMSFGIGYNDNIDKARETIWELIRSDQRILKEPEPFIAVSELANSSVNFVVRVWVNTPEYWNVFYDMHENVKKKFDENKISIPYPQTDVHIHQVKK
ncbi:MAG: mechanosensitive ion channel [Bacteroidales bacterium]|nr:MAG: mechanosensitive ion channel [Bacteroidales bacterium]